MRARERDQVTTDGEWGATGEDKSTGPGDVNMQKEGDRIKSKNECTYWRNGNHTRKIQC